MYSILYMFRVKPNKEDDFIKSWTGLTELIYKYEGSLGSRLHKKEGNNFIAYALWPDKCTFDNAGTNLPNKAEYYRDVMKASCQSIEVLHKLDVVRDLLHSEQDE